MGAIDFAPAGVDVVATVSGLNVPVGQLSGRQVRFFRRGRGKQLHLDRGCSRLGPSVPNEELLSLVEYASESRNPCPTCTEGYHEARAFGDDVVAYWSACLLVSRHAVKVQQAEELADRVVSGDLCRVDVDTFTKVESSVARLDSVALPYRLDRWVVEGEAASGPLQRALEELSRRARAAEEVLRPLVVDELLSEAVAFAATVESCRVATESLRERTMRAPYGTAELSSDGSGAVLWPLRWLQEAESFLMWSSSSIEERPRSVQEFLDGFESGVLSVAGELSRLEEVPAAAVLDGGAFATPLEWARAEYEHALSQMVAEITAMGRLLLEEGLGQYAKEQLVLVGARNLSGRVPHKLVRRLLVSSSVASHKGEWAVARLSPLQAWLLDRDYSRWGYRAITAAARRLSLLSPVEEVAVTSAVFFEMLDADPWNEEPEQLWQVAAAVSA